MAGRVAQIPPDFAKDAETMTNVALGKKYNKSPQTIANWKSRMGSDVAAQVAQKAAPRKTTSVRKQAVSAASHIAEIKRLRSAIAAAEAALADYTSAHQKEILEEYRALKSIIGDIDEAEAAGL